MKFLTPIFFCLLTTICFSQIDIKTFNLKFPENPKTTFIYFYTDWCAVCKIQENEIEKNFQLKNKLENEVYYLKIDAESEFEIDFLNQKYKPNTTSKKKEIHDFIFEFISPKEINFPLWIFLDNDLIILGKYVGLIKNKDLEQLLNNIKKSNK